MDSPRWGNILLKCLLVKCGQKVYWARADGIMTLNKILLFLVFVLAYFTFFSFQKSAFMLIKENIEGRKMPCPTAGKETWTWLPSLTKTPRPGLSWRPRRPTLPLCGCPFTLPAPWSSGSGSILIALVSLTSLQRMKLEIVTYSKWCHGDTRGPPLVQHVTTSCLIYSAQSKRHQCFVFLSSFLNLDESVQFPSMCCRWLAQCSSSPDKSDGVSHLRREHG